MQETAHALPASAKEAILYGCSLNGQDESIDWLPERARWRCLARSGLPAVSRESAHKDSKKERGQSAAIFS